MEVRRSLVRLIGFTIVIPLSVVEVMAMDKEPDILAIIGDRMRTDLKSVDTAHQAQAVMAADGDSRMSEALRKLGDVDRPWTVSNILHQFLQRDHDDNLRAPLLTLLAASRDPRAAVVLGKALDDSSPKVRLAATYGILDHFAGVRPSAGTAQDLEAAKKWWLANRDEVERSAEDIVNGQLDSDLLLLKHAAALETATLGEGEKSRCFEAFRTVGGPSGPPRCYLWWLVEKATPAGKLYGAAALLRRAPEEGRKALGQLVSDRSKVSFRSGCEVIEVEVGQVASSLLEDGSYLDFCGVAAPAHQ